MAMVLNIGEKCNRSSVYRIVDERGDDFIVYGDSMKDVKRICGYYKIALYDFDVYDNEYFFNHNEAQAA